MTDRKKLRAMLCGVVACAAACATQQRHDNRLPILVVEHSTNGSVPPPPRDQRAIASVEQPTQPSQSSGWPMSMRTYQAPSGSRSGQWDDVAVDAQSDARNPRAMIERDRARGRPSPNASLARGGFYMEATNAEAAPVDGCGGTHLAIMYVPSATFRLERIAVRAGVAQLGIFDDDNGRPGRLVAIGPATGTQEPGWSEARLDEPVTVQANHRYWIYKGPGGCATSTGTQHALYYGHFDGQPAATWEGPHRWHAYQFRFYGTGEQP